MLHNTISFPELGKRDATCGSWRGGGSERGGSISEVNIFCPFSMGSCYMTLTHSCCVLASADECNMHAHRRWIAAGAAYWPPKQEGNINGLCSFGPGLCLLMHTFPTDCAGQGFTLRTTIASNLFHIPDQSCSKSDDVTIELLSMRPLVSPFLFLSRICFR